MTTDDTDALRAWVLGRATDLDDATLTETTPLIAERYLTSLHVPELLLFLESLRGTEIDVTTLQPGDFQDLATIRARFLEVG